MAVDVSKRSFELFSGAKRARLLPTLAIAIIVTSLVVVPLILRVTDADADLPQTADASLVTVDTADADPAPLDQATLDGSVLISVNDPSASAVSFALFEAGSDETLYASQDLTGPTFDLVVGESGSGRPLDTTALANGDYELFLTVASPDGEERTAIGFSVLNP